VSIKIFFDMDGVLVDFATGVANVLGDVIANGDESRRQFRRLHNYEGPDKELPITAEYIERITTIKDAKGERTKWMKRVSDAVFAVVGTGGHEYWASLPSLPGFQAMITHAQDLVGTENVYVCTAPVEDKTGGCESGKREWIQTNTTIPADQVYVTQDKPSVLRNFPNDTCILVDDRKKYVDAWQNGGGVAVRHPAPADMTTVQNTIAQLNLLVNNLE